MISRTEFGRDLAGREVDLFTLSNGRGLTARITNYGGIVTELWVPDRTGQAADVVLGFDSLAPYLRPHPYFGAIIGRIAGRLTPATFTLDGQSYSLAANQGPHHLHGGAAGFDRRTWTAVAGKNPEEPSLELRYLSPAGEEGYPGNLAVKVTYAVTAAQELRIDYEAVTDRATPLSLTNHSYFNLRGEGAGDIRTHEIQIEAEEYTPVDIDFAHTGKRTRVAGLPVDFRHSAPMGRLIDAPSGRHGENYLLGRRGGLRLAARVKEPQSGRIMEVRTTQPCLQFYTGLNLDKTVTGKSGRTYQPFDGFCLECQSYPAAPHFPEFESTILRPGAAYRETTVYRFGVE